MSQDNSSYSRSSMTILFVKHASSNSNIYNSAKSIHVPSKYDDNTFGDNTLSVPISMTPDLTNLSGRGNSIYMAIKSQKVVNNIIKEIFTDKKTGLISLEKIFERGEYGATDADYIAAMNSHLKDAALKDKGVDMLKNVYFQVFDIQGYNVTGEKTKTHTINGTVYLYKVDIDSILTTGEFWNMIDLEKPDVSKQNMLNSYNFSIKEISKGDFYSSTQNVKNVNSSALVSNLLKKKDEAKEETLVYKTEDEINYDLLDNCVTSSQVKWEKNVDAFKAKFPVFTADPLAIKVGQKEGLEIDHLYEITENRMDEKGVISLKHIGWVRAKSVVNNRAKADGKTQPSIFYKVACGKVEKGMGAIHNAETGLVFGATYALGNSLMSGIIFNVDYITHWSPGLRIGLSYGGFNSQFETKYLTYDNGNESTVKLKGQNTWLDLNISKIYQSNRFEFTPAFGFYMANVSYKSYSYSTFHDLTLDGTNGEGIKSTSYGAFLGAKVGVNFGKYFQLNAGYKFGVNFSSKFDNDKTLSNGGGNLNLKLSGPDALFVGVRIFGF